MSNIQSIAVFCGSSKGNNPIYSKIVTQLGYLIAQKSYTLVYGGSALGLMHYIAEAVLEKNGNVIGVIPTFFPEEIIYMKELPELILVDTMAERKQKMLSISDAFIALPGGYGTFDELFEMLALSQLEVHKKPIGLLNINGYYNPFLAQLDIMVSEGFMSKVHKKILYVANAPEELLNCLEKH